MRVWSSRIQGFKYVARAYGYAGSGFKISNCLPGQKLLRVQGSILSSLLPRNEGFVAQGLSASSILLGQKGSGCSRIEGFKYLPENKGFGQVLFSA